MTTFHNPVIPIDLPMLDSSPGTLIKIEGCIPPSSKRFTVSLHCYPEGHTALEIILKFDENYIVKRTIIHSKVWYEEREGVMPMLPGRNFEILILICERKFKIGFNGQHFSKFNHKVPHYTITNLGIGGDVMVHAITFQERVKSRHVGLVFPRNTEDGPAFPPFPPPRSSNGPFHGGSHANNNNMHPPQMGHGGYGHQRSLYPQLPPTGYRGGYPGYGSQIYYQLFERGYPHFPIPLKGSGLLDKAGKAVVSVLGNSPVLENVIKMQLKAEKKAMKYGLPLVEVGVGAYGVTKGLKHSCRRSRNSSSSSSSN